MAEFIFVARNPSSGEQIGWQAKQNFADGTSRMWTPGTKLISIAVASTGTLVPVKGAGKIRNSPE